MRFSLQDVRKSIHRHAGDLTVSLQFLKPGESQTEIASLIAYYEAYLEKPQRFFSVDDARACIGDYRLANCLMAALSHWYNWVGRSWTEVVHEMGGDEALLALGSPTQLRLALYRYVNEQHGGFLDAQNRQPVLQTFAETYHIDATALDYLLLLDNESEALLTRTSEVPDPQSVSALYNQWVFEAALFNASNVRFVIDCAAFTRLSSATDEEKSEQRSRSMPDSGIGTVIKRLCYLARRLGVYYDLSYEQPAKQQSSPLLTTEPSYLALTLYGPQEVTGAPQQYGFRLARLTRLLLNYGTARRTNTDQSTQKSATRQTGKKTSLSGAILTAEATVHFLQRTYRFTFDHKLLDLMPQEQEQRTDNPIKQKPAEVLFDSSIEQNFAEAFQALAHNAGADGWRLEREPEPLLLPRSICIPDFALTRGEKRIYVEILGFWTPAYRERKIEKLQQLRGRTDLVLAIPIEAKEAFTDITPSFPTIFYRGQLSASEMLHLLRQHYDDIESRLAQIDREEVRQHIIQAGILAEADCYTTLHCYRRSELQQAAEIIGAYTMTTLATSQEETETNHRTKQDPMLLVYVPGLGICAQNWLQRLQQNFLNWLAQQATTATLTIALQTLRQQQPALTKCNDTTLETLLTLWPEIHLQRDSIFEVIVELLTTPQKSLPEPINQDAQLNEENVLTVPKKKIVREKRPSATSTNARKRASEDQENTIQGNLWDFA